jgi:hypothetical protein
VVRAHVGNDGAGPDEDAIALSLGGSLISSIIILHIKN